MDSFLSSNGGRQGDCLAGLLCARLFQPIYESAVDGLDVTACAIMDDFSLVGRLDAVLVAFDRYKSRARAEGVLVHPDSCIQFPRAPPSSAARAAADERGLQIVQGNADYLGAAIGLDDGAMREWLHAKLSSISPVQRAIADPDFPVLLALRLAKSNALSVPTYLNRTLPFRVSADPLVDFDRHLRSTLLCRLDLPAPLPAPAFISLTQPGRNGGLGLRLRSSIAPAAKWASAAITAPDVVKFAAMRPPLPFVADREACHALLVQAGVRVSDVADDDGELDAGGDAHPCPNFTLPVNPVDIAAHYLEQPRIPCLQRSFTRQIEDRALASFFSSSDCSPVDRARLRCCSRMKGQPAVNAWLSASAASAIEDTHVRVAVRLRLGLPPLSSLPFASTRCPLCEFDFGGDCWHALSCQSIKRLSVTSRHDKIANLLINFFNSNLFLARAVKKAFANKLPDVEVHLPRETIFIDVSGTHPFNPSYLERTLTNISSALDNRANIKINKYSAWARERNARFIPFVLDTFGRLHKDAADIIKLACSERAGLAPSPNSQSSQSLLTELSLQWQRGNGEIISQWAIMCRNHLSNRLAFSSPSSSSSGSSSSSSSSCCRDDLSLVVCGGFPIVT